ncbi:hypothetical protein [Mycoplasma struthionis]|uniref:Uncharacterized protein n=1 Tax=Mycoplasma struthionis TaxID=538220 RepID=A0A3G8LG59_9MOLU|nr:hypothetical protein [Mycoplasma struthionis]AZG68626.1 hypothetical protein EGN60_01420 [Mycoplasma struthionis]
MAIYTKKSRLVKTLVSIGAIGVVSVAAASAIYTTRTRVGRSSALKAFERNSTPKLNTEEVITEDKNNSNTDSNLVKKINLEEQVVTKLIFKDSADEKEKFTAEIISKKGEDKEIDAVAYIPSLWIYDKEKQKLDKPKVVLGQENIIWIKKNLYQKKQLLKLFLMTKFIKLIDLEQKMEKFQKFHNIVLLVLNLQKMITKLF